MDIHRKATTIALDTLGCKLNQAESESLALQLREAGYQVVPPLSGADIYVVNTCTVTHVADRKARHHLRMARRLNPGVLLVVTGCYAERAPEEVVRLGGASLVVDNSQKLRLVEILQECGHPSHTFRTGDVASGPAGLRTRTFIKVQDGCSSYCTYCIVPLVRRQEQSVAAEQVIATVRERHAAGYNEIVLTGVRAGTYQDNGTNLTGLLERVLGETQVPRVRLSSLQPQEISEELLRLWRDGRLCRHFHLSLQSGSDTVLRRMNRRYSAAEYAGAVSLVRTFVPGAAITTDVIVGFPGETEDEFEASYRFCEQMAFARMHVFQFSPREGTVAAGMPDQVTDHVKRHRSRRMLALAGECVPGFSRLSLGMTMPVLWEHRSPGGVWTGLTDNYIRVYTKSSEDLSNRLTPATLTEIRDDGLWADT